MKRRNVQLAFVGEGVTASTDADPDTIVDGDEAVDIEVTGGKLMVVVPATTPDNEIFEKASTLGGELVLENGLRLSFEINGDAVGAQFSASHQDTQDDTHVGLSSLPDVPGGV
jgi:hypothetical protein